MNGRVWMGSAAGLLMLAGAVQVAGASSASRDGRAFTGFSGAASDVHMVPRSGPHVGSRGGTVVVDAHGLLVAERNAAAVVRVDRDGKPVTRLDFAGLLGELVTDGAAAAFVADRAGDRIVRLNTTRGDRIGEQGSVPVAEPYGLALSPDGGTLYATSVADHRLVAIDTGTMELSWSVQLRAEPRGVAVSADGTRAVVGFLSSGALAEVHLDRRGETVKWHALDPRNHVKIEMVEDDWGEGSSPMAKISEARSRFQVPTDQGRRHARNAFTVGYLGHGQIVAPHQISTPQMKRIPSRTQMDSYGGGPDEVPAISHHLAFVTPRAAGQAQVRVSGITGVHQPRAMAYDARRDRLYVAGYGDDDLVGIADASLPSAYSLFTLDEPVGVRERCGPDGMVVDGDVVWMHCELTRKLVRIEPDALDLDDKPWRGEGEAVRRGPQLVASIRSDAVERGADLFRRATSEISDGGTMACASCHPEGRQDGLSWRLGGSILQTPMLAGRLASTEPYKWGGLDPTLRDSFRHTIERLGGSGLSRSELADLQAYVRWLPSATRPRVEHAAAVFRGHALFEGELGCDGCHGGDAMADNNQYPFDAWGLEETDTPSLKGLAHTAPYYHDGSAVDLWALVTDKGSVHDMADFSELSTDQARDLVAYLETL